MPGLQTIRTCRAGDPEIPPPPPPEAPPGQPPEVPGEPVPESEPAPPLEVPPDAPPEVPPSAPPETRAVAGCDRCTDRSRLACRSSSGHLLAA
jgi:hypothetical protein